MRKHSKVEERNASQEPETAGAETGEPIVAEMEECEGMDANSAEQSAEQALAGEVASLKDRLMRLQADFDNYRKRIVRDQADMIKRSNENLIEALLPVLDHFNHAAQMVSKDADASVAAYLEGFKLVNDELKKVLESFGVKPIEAVGKEFDANLHDALMTAPAAQGAKAGEIVMELRKGYTLHGRVLRASQVVVAAEQEDASAEPSGVED